MGVQKLYMHSSRDDFKTQSPIVLNNDNQSELDGTAGQTVFNGFEVATKQIFFVEYGLLILLVCSNVIVKVL